MKTKECKHTHAYYAMERGDMGWSTVGCYLIVRDEPNFGYGELTRIVSAQCHQCLATLSIGPSNDRDGWVHVEMAHAGSARGDRYWSRFANKGDGFDWDIARPLAEQWPWGPADPAHMARGDAMLDEVVAKVDRVIENATSVAADGLLTRDETATIIAQSSDSYEPKP